MGEFIQFVKKWIYATYHHLRKNAQRHTPSRHKGKSQRPPVEKIVQFIDVIFQISQLHNFFVKSEMLQAYCTTCLHNVYILKQTSAVIAVNELIMKPFTISRPTMFINAINADAD